jgi:hypothetical protein
MFKTAGGAEISTGTAGKRHFLQRAIKVGELCRRKEQAVCLAHAGFGYFSPKKMARFKYVFLLTSYKRTFFDCKSG